MKSAEAIATLGALAQDTRLEIFRLLVEVGPQGLPAGQIADRLRVSRATMSFHLMQLSHAGLVVSERQSRQIIYAADMARMAGLISFLTDNCCSGHPELCFPQATPAWQPPAELPDMETRPNATRRSC